MVVYIYEMTENKESKMTMTKKEAMKLAIVGNGIASRTVLSLIMKELRSSQPNALQEQLHSLHIFDKSADVQDSPPLYTGLWSASTHLLKRRVGISLDTIQNLGCAVKESGYRDQKGRWLLKPEVGMLPFPDRPSLHFFENHQLLELICKQEDIEELAQKDSRIKIHRNSDISKVFQQQNRTYIKTSDDQTIETNLILGADGMLSRTKEIVHNVTVDDYLTHRGYRVFRGVCPVSALSSSSTTPFDPKVAFQTWGPSARFAIVPVNGYRDVAWFAAVSSPKLKPSEYFTHSSSSSFNSSPLLNGGKIATSEEKQQLSSLLSSWHSPIPEIVHHAINDKNQRIVVNEAFALKEVTEGMSVVGRKAKTIVLFLGDAAFTLDPILAQGAGVAVEEGVEAFDVILDIVEEEEEKNIYYFPHSFEEVRLKRLKKLHKISNLAQFIGHQDSPLLNSIRDNILLATPSLVKGKVFDGFINFVDQRETDPM